VHEYVDALITKALESQALHGEEQKKNLVFFDGLIQNIQDPKAIRNQLLSILHAGSSMSWRGITAHWQNCEGRLWEFLAWEPKL
jgi:hypothetical protein